MRYLLTERGRRPLYKENIQEDIQKSFVDEVGRLPSSAKKLYTISLDEDRYGVSEMTVYQDKKFFYVTSESSASSVPIAQYEGKAPDKKKFEAEMKKILDF